MPTTGWRRYATGRAQPGNHVRNLAVVDRLTHRRPRKSVPNRCIRTCPGSATHLWGAHSVKVPYFSERHVHHGAADGDGTGVCPRHWSAATPDR